MENAEIEKMIAERREEKEQQTKAELVDIRKKSINEKNGNVVKNALSQLENANNDKDKLLDFKAMQTNDVKEVIDILATKTALANDETLENVVGEKSEELRNDAETKRVQAETYRIEKEALRVKAEKEKEIANLDKLISIKIKEVEDLKADSDKEKAYFDSNKDILKYIGIREKKTLKVMKTFMVPALTVFIIVQLLLFPFTFVGLVLESAITIVGNVCGTIKNNAVKIAIGILVLVVLFGVAFCVYFFGIRGIMNIAKI